MRKSFVVLVVTAALTIAVFAASSSGKQPTQPITVGDFAVLVSQAIGAPTTSPKTAISNLQARGLNMPLDLQATLTERQAVSMFHDLGVINVRTSNPNDQVTPDKAEAIIGSVNLSALSASILPADIEDAADCVKFSSNRGECQECCKIAVGPIPDPGGQGNFGDPGKVCAKICNSVLPPGLQSPSEPQP